MMIRLLFFSYLRNVKPKSMTMKKKLTIRLALLILCAFSINTVFAQDVRQKPVIKKETATTTKQAPASTKKQTSSKQTTKKQPTTSSKKKVVTTHEWEWVGPFSEGVSAVRDTNDKYGFIDKTGKVVIPYKWEDAYFLNGRAVVQDVNSNFWYIDRTGKVVKSVY